MIEKGEFHRALSYPKAVVAFAGSRDHYQLPLALYEGGLLESLITDLYWPAERRWFASSFGRLFSEDTVAMRYCKGLSSERVQISPGAFGAFTLMSATGTLNLNWYKDQVLSEMARRIALQEKAALFCYTSYALRAFRQHNGLPKYRFLFLLQADPRTRRRILLEEIERTPTGRASLLAEQEFSLPKEHFEDLYAEPHLANGWVASSSFAASTLAEYGIDADKIHVVPYGVDGNTFVKRHKPPTPSTPFKVTYVGKLVQSKGLSYLLEAVRRMETRSVRLTLCSRGVIDKELMDSYDDLKIDIKVGLSGKQLAYELHSSDICVFPSLAEGFGHVILETMSCGVPIITTSNTCAPDVMVDGTHGFIIPIRDVEAIMEKLSWAIDHRTDLADMGESAAAQARLFSWERFRSEIREVYKEMVSSV